MYVYIEFTVILAEIGPVVPLVATKLAISPFPLALSPILGLSFTHEYVIVPSSTLFILSDNVVEKSTAKVLSPLHKV